MKQILEAFMEGFLSVFNWKKGFEVHEFGSNDGGG